ncbi:unnamed protein product [Triticum turgidum subsp. durum]|uniref:SMP domain-containing protein n=1 Tax=Triticum turgidum subsp. durum TaxID=4567 RepID=A0A9R0S489_TRITD|nr:unnamed protein product [Triticum turgidum subsp. durum]
MSQGQQRRPSSDQAQADGGGQSQEQGGGAVRYGDVAAKVRATGQDVYIPGDLAAQAQSAADANLWAARDEEKAKLGEVLSNATAKLVAHKERNATAKLVADKEVESDDAARVASAETRNKDDKTVRPGGIAASVAAAARLNKQDA